MRRLGIAAGILVAAVAAAFALAWLPGAEEAVTAFDKDGLKIEAFLDSPPADAYGYRITYKGRSAVVSGDTRKVQNMVRFSRDADVLVHEALNPQMVELVAAALEKAGHARQAKMSATR